MTTSEYEIQDPLERQSCVTNERDIKFIGRVGHALNVAVERFMTIGEIIAEDNPEIKTDMFESCRDARDAGKSIEHLCEISSADDMNYLDMVVTLREHSAIILAARSLLSSITRVLLLVDIVVVKQLLTTKRKICRNVKSLESVINFTRFVRAFSLFGIEMVELAFFIGSRRNNLKEERRRAQIHSARQILERSITILLTSSKASLIHTDCVIAKENRDTVFCQIRRAMDLIHFVVKDSIFDSSWRNEQQSSYGNNDKGTIYSTLKHFTYLMECLRYTTKNNDRSLYAGNNNYSKNLNIISKENIRPSEINNHFLNENNRRISISSSLYAPENETTPMFLNSESVPLFSAKITEQLLIAFDKLLEKTHDFTDSAYTSQENRENILHICERCKVEFNKYLNNIFRNENLIDEEINSILNAVKILTDQLIISVGDHVIELFQSLDISVDLVNNFQSFAIKQELNRLQERANRFHDCCDHIIDVCKLLQHVAFTETLQVQAKCLAINLRIYGPQVLTAAKLLSKYPSSSPANENLDAFVEMWKWLTSQITSLAKQILESTNELGEPKLGLANLNKIKTTTDPQKTFNAGQEEEGKNALTELDAKNEANDGNYTGKWNEELNDNNDILKRAKNMSAMAFSMYQFTKGNGTLRTTQDLFTQAEYFAEEANRLYKVLRQFSYQVPASQIKKDLLGCLDTVPTFVQALQFTVKDHTVGKAATFVKVDHVIRGTKNLMSVINNVVTKCFECATKYKLDFTSLSGGMTSGSLRGDDSSAGGMSDSKGTTNSSEGSM